MTKLIKLKDDTYDKLTATLKGSYNDKVVGLLEVYHKFTASKPDGIPNGILGIPSKPSTPRSIPESDTQVNQVNQQSSGKLMVNYEEILLDIQNKVDYMHNQMIPDDGDKKSPTGRSPKIKFVFKADDFPDAEQPQEEFTHGDLEGYMLNDLNTLRFSKGEDFEQNVKNLKDTYENKKAAEYIVKEATRLRKEYSDKKLEEETEVNKANKV